MPFAKQIAARRKWFWGALTELSLALIVASGAEPESLFVQPTTVYPLVVKVVVVTMFEVGANFGDKPGETSFGTRGLTLDHLLFHTYDTF